MKFSHLLLITGLLSLTACSEGSSDNQDQSSERSDAAKEKIANMKLAQDKHSFARPNEARVTHLSWDAEVDFEKRQIIGVASFDIDNIKGVDRILLDTKDLTIHKVWLDDSLETQWSIGPEDEIKGAPLEVEIAPETKQIHISYNSSPDAGALLWVEGDKPFLFTQSQAILGRTWIPCQDSPGVRYTYDATVKVREDLLALMSATNPTAKNETGVYHFKMAQPIPSYLMALAVGDIEYREVGPNTAVYATPDLIDQAAWEFEEMEQMLSAAEELYGDYVWERYDLLILPAAFPFGGMENPRLTFATPTIIAGDRSLTALVAHELAHSWSGNLVTNSTWDDFWLNEGFTVYFEQRIMEAVYGKEIAEMLAQLSYAGLKDEVEEIMDKNPNDTHLKLHLEGRDPDVGMTAIAYDKGYFFLRMIEEKVGREKFDAFLKEYFTSHAFQVMDTEQFVDYLTSNLITPELAQEIQLDAWIYGPGLPDNFPEVHSTRLDSVDQVIASWSDGSLSTDEIPWDQWVYQERYRFLTNMAESVTAEQMADLDAAYEITATGNNEVLFAWLEKSIEKGYEPAYARLETFLVNVGRRKFLTPLYKAMKETGKMDMAMDIYKKARPNYHSVATGTMDELLEYSGA